MVAAIQGDYESPAMRAVTQKRGGGPVETVRKRVRQAEVDASPGQDPQPGSWFPTCAAP
jgi:hypothetical protein